MRTVSVKSAARVLDVLELLATLREGIGVNELARRLGFPNSSASSLIATLENRGYVTLEPDGYRLAEAYRESGWVGGMPALLVRTALPVMQRLSQRTGESAFLGVMNRNNEVRYLQKVVSPNPVRYDGDMSLTRPAYAISIGIVLLAGLSDSALDAYFEGRELKAVTPHTPTDQAAVRRLIESARRDGYVRMVDTHVAGAAAVAAPVRRGDRVIAGLTVMCPTQRFEQQAQTMVAAAVEAARELSQALPK